MTGNALGASPILKVKNIFRRFNIVSTFIEVGGGGSGAETHYATAKHGGHYPEHLKPLSSMAPCWSML